MGRASVHQLGLTRRLAAFGHLAGYRRLREDGRFESIGPDECEYAAGEGSRELCNVQRPKLRHRGGVVDHS